MLLCPDWQQRLRPPNTELGYAACSNWLLPASSPIAVGGVPHPGKSGGTGASSPSAKSLPRRNTKGMHPCHPPWLLMKNEWHWVANPPQIANPPHKHKLQ